MLVPTSVATERAVLPNDLNPSLALSTTVLVSINSSPALACASLNLSKAFEEAFNVVGYPFKSLITPSKRFP